MENEPFEDVFPIKHRDMIPLLVVFQCYKKNWGGNNKKHLASFWMTLLNGPGISKHMEGLLEMNDILYLRYLLRYWYIYIIIYIYICIHIYIYIIRAVVSFSLPEIFFWKSQLFFFPFFVVPDSSDKSARRWQQPCSCRALRKFISVYVVMHKTARRVLWCPWVQRLAETLGVVFWHRWNEEMEVSGLVKLPQNFPSKGGDFLFYYFFNREKKIITVVMILWAPKNFFYFQTKYIYIQPLFSLLFFVCFELVIWHLTCGSRGMIWWSLKCQPQL